jgi:hypothetical protein
MADVFPVFPTTFFGLEPPIYVASSVLTLGARPCLGMKSNPCVLLWISSLSVFQEVGPNFIVFKSKGTNHDLLVVIWIVKIVFKPGRMKMINWK